MNIAVYLGSNEGKDPIYREAVTELGTWIGRNHHKLIYGGSKVGLMGILAESVLREGGSVIGVEPRFFVEGCLQLEGLTELIVTEDMQERKAKMIELADMFIAFPGGTGTIEEISEVVSAGCLELIDAVFGYYNVNGYYDFIEQGYRQMVEQGFMTRENCEKIKFWKSLKEIAEAIELR